jgi:hypothetical protein
VSISGHWIDLSKSQQTPHKIPKPIPMLEFQHRSVTPRGLFQNPQNSKRKPESIRNNEVHPRAPIPILGQLGNRTIRGNFREIPRSSIHNFKPRDSLGKVKSTRKLNAQF